MIKTYDLAGSDWLGDFIYARAPHTKANAKYGAPIGGALKNEFNPKIGEHDYISLISRETYSGRVEVNVRCAFSGSGAPCIVFTDELSEGEDFPEYGLHFEVCIYTGGVNVWKILPYYQRPQRPILPSRIFFEEWSLGEKEVDCRIEVENKRITVLLEGRRLELECEDFPEKFRVGFTSCEGPCEFSSFSVSSGE